MDFSNRQITLWLLTIALLAAASPGCRIGAATNTPTPPPADNPLTGIWKEDVQFACGSGEEVAPERPIRELDFRDDGSFGVTWKPFETYVDYWGTYKYDPAQGTLDLTVDDGNYIPDDLDGSGSLSFDEQGRLILMDMWLGSPSGSAGPANCGHRFTR
jgi:hypothetical protein